MIRPLAFLLLFGPLVAQAQNLDLTAVNAAFSGTVIFKIDKHDRLVMDFYDEQGRYREDVAPLEQLASGSVHYSSEENAIVLECSADHAQCITKEIFKMNVVRITSRSTLPRPPDDPEGTRTIELIKALIEEGANQLGGTANETAPPQSRMKSR